jgi:hypothetical protein
MTLAMLRSGTSRFLAILAVVLLGLGAIVGSGGGGGRGGDVEPSPPPPGGGGTGADGVAIFWYPYDYNVATGTGNSVRETADGGYIVTGFQAAGFAPPFDVFLMKTDGTGTAQWKKRFTWPGGVEAFSVRQNADGGYIVAGRTQTTGNNDVYLLRTDASGNALPGWPRTYSSSGSFDDVGYDVLPVGGGADGFIVVGGGRGATSGTHDILVLRTDANGNPLTGWPKYYGNDNVAPAGETGRAIAEIAGGYLIAGYTGWGWSGVILKIDNDGDQQWLKVYGPSSTSSERFEAMAVTAAGEIVVAGRRSLVSGQPPTEALPDALVVKLDANGNELWRRTYGLGEADEAYGIALTRNSSGNPDGGYVIAGYTRSYSGTVNPNEAWKYEDLHLIKVAANGDRVWEKVKGNRIPTSDRGSFVHAVSDGGIVVTGSSDGVVMLAKFDRNGATVNLGATDLTYTVPPSTGIITLGNAVDVTAAGVRGLIGPRQVGDTALSLLISAVGGTTPPSAFCTGGGSYSFNPSPAPPTPPPAAGSSYTLTFSNCIVGAMGDQTQINGVATIAIDTLSGSLTSASYVVQTTLTSVNLVLVDVGGTLTSQIAGGMRYRRDRAVSGNYSEVSSSISMPAPQALTFAETGGVANRSATIGPFTVSSFVEPGLVSIGVMSDTLTVVSSNYSFAVAVLQPLQAASANATPAYGSFRVTATDNSRLTATVTNGTVAIEGDTNADGTIDFNLSVPWEYVD